MSNTQANNAASIAIDLNQVSYSYEKTNTSHFYIPRWQIKRGERVFLHGNSGSGKTTMLNLLAGILTPQQGSITLLEQPFSSLSASKRDKFRAQHIGVVFQQFNLIPYLSVLKNIELATYFAKLHTPDVTTRARSLLAKLKLPESMASKAASALSVGQQQRVAIARALINHPELLLVDEATSALDASARDAFMDILIEMCESYGTTLIFVSHDMYLQRFFNSKIEIGSLQHSHETIQC